MKGCKTRDDDDLYNRWQRIMRRSALVPIAMRELVRLFTQIALLRRGPQDLPASTLLLALTIVGFLAINLLMHAILPSAGPAGASGKASEAQIHNSFPAQLLLDTAFTLAWYVVLLRLARRSERTLQTSTAVFGFQLVLTPLYFTSGWLLRYASDPAWALPTVLFEIIVVVWIIAANSFIVKAALEWSVGASVALVILQTLAGVLLSRAVFYPLPG
jgi:hypothetical protein